MMEFLKRHPILRGFLLVIAAYPLVFLIHVLGFRIYEWSTGRAASEAARDLAIQITVLAQFAVLGASVAIAAWRTNRLIARIFFALLLVAFIGLTIASLVKILQTIPAC